jgi:hypothetical protein
MSQNQLFVKGIINICPKSNKDGWGNNDGTIVGGSKIAAGKVGEALEFNGVDQYVGVGSPADGSLDFGQDMDFTIAAWVNVPDLPGDQYAIVGKGDRGGNNRTLFKILSGGNIIFTLAEPKEVDVNGVENVVDGEWHYLVAVVDRDKFFRVYVDEILDTEGGPSDGANLDTESPLFIGKSHQNGTDPRRFFKGLIDEVCIYDRALSEDEILQNLAAKGLAVSSSTEKLALTWGEMKVSR